ncbi:protein DMP4-like [Musa acuminata AAA Group]|uniref:protein DMP4-like n=1 Tax=Musa acuminata AAA Group TaxID=214697 RepID=UPI0031D29436
MPYLLSSETGESSKERSRRTKPATGVQEMENPGREGDPEAQPLLNHEAGDRITAIQQVISQTYQGTAHLANHLPTGTVLAFQFLSPVFTTLGRCTESSRFMTACLLALCALSCFLLSFTDSFYDEATRRVRYGVATFRGFRVIDGLQPVAPELAVSHRLGPLDFLHAFTSLVVFAAVALLDKNVVSCYYPMPTDNEFQVLTALPVGIGVVGSALLVTFPTIRHGIGFPVTHTQ